MKNIRCMATMALLAISANGASAQAAEAKFPEKPLRYIVPFPPGGSTDIVARIVAAALTTELKEQVVIDNRGGVGGTLGAAVAANASPDGYTMFACNIASLAVSPALYRDPGYDADTAFAPIGLIGSNPNTLVVHPSLPAKSVAEFIALAKSQPGKLNYASAGVGTSPQLTMELFKERAGLDIVHVAYKGGGPALVDLMGGHVRSMYATVPSVLGAVRSGALRALAVSSKKRARDLPDVPTLVESGMPDFEVISWQGLCTPSGVPKAILTQLQSALTSVMTKAETNKQLELQGIEATPLIADKYGAFIRAERAKWIKVVEGLGIPKR